MKMIILAAALLAPLALSGCSNCIDSGICPFVDNGPTQPQVLTREVSVPRGATTRVELPVSTVGVPAGLAFELFAKKAEALARNDPSVLVSSANGTVIARRTAATFVGTTAVIDVTVSADAPLGLADGLFGIRRVGTSGPGGSVDVLFNITAP
jgi:hypothetical protein